MSADKAKILFVVANELEAKLVCSLYRGLLSVDECEVLNISTGAYCCQQGNKLPEYPMDELGVPYKELAGYKTRNILKVLKAENPDVVVVGSDQEYMRRAFVFASEGMGIPLVMFQLGISSNAANNSIIVFKRTVHQLKYYAWNIASKYLYLLRTVVSLRWNLYRILLMLVDDVRVALTIDDNRGKYAQHILVAGSWEKQTLEERGIDKGHIIVTGRPMFPRLAEEVSPLCTDGKKVILFLTVAMVEHGWWSTNRRGEFIKGVVDSIYPILGESINLVIKIHPTEDIAEYRKILNGRQSAISILKDIALEDAVNNSDVVVVGGYSTTVLEASALKKPVVMLNVYNEPESIPYAKMGLAIEVNQLGRLRGVVEELLYNQESRQQLLDKAKAYFDFNREFVDGKATERIVGILMKLARKHKSEVES